MTTIRAFIAIPLPEPVTAALGEVGRALAGRVPSGAVRWVRPRQIHLTLAFLGDIALERLPAVIETLDATAAQQPSFTLHLGSLGCFPNARRPRVIWAGLAGDVARLKALKSQLDARLATLGWPPEDKPFHPHLTLGRVKDARKAEGASWDAAVPRLAVPVTAVHLIESQLRPDGPVYTTRHTSRLAAAD